MQLRAQLLVLIDTDKENFCFLKTFPLFSLSLIISSSAISAISCMAVTHSWPTLALFCATSAAALHFEQALVLQNSTFCLDGS